MPGQGFGELTAVCDHRGRGELGVEGPSGGSAGRATQELDERVALGVTGRVELGLQTPAQCGLRGLRDAAGQGEQQQLPVSLTGALQAIEQQ